MVKAVSRKRGKKERITILPDIRHRPPRWRILPPEVIHIIVGLLKHDKATLRACSLATRDFSQPALSCIGRHITVNYVPRIKLCARLLTANSAFQHVRSLDIGVTSKSSSPKDYLTEQLTILDIFSQRQTLTRLWLSKIPFPSFESSQRENIQNIVAALGSTVNDLGLYECSFLSRSDVISFICAFPHCDSLYVRDCVMGGGESAGDMFSGLPKHKLSLEALELTSTSPGRVDASVSPIIDVSSLIEDADLDVSKLSVLICNVESDKQAHSVVTATSSSPVQHLELSCAEPGGFQAFLNPLPEEWSLEYLTIRPPTCRTDLDFWQSAFQNFPAFPRLEELTIVYHCPSYTAFNRGFWTYLDQLLGQGGIFPRSMHIDIRITIRSTRPDQWWQRNLLYSLPSFRRYGTIKLWGLRE